MYSEVIKQVEKYGRENSITNKSDRMDSKKEVEKPPFSELGRKENILCVWIISFTKSKFSCSIVHLQLFELGTHIYISAYSFNLEQSTNLP